MISTFAGNKMSAMSDRLRRVSHVGFLSLLRRSEPDETNSPTFLSTSKSSDKPIEVVREPILPGIAFIPAVVGPIDDHDESFVISPPSPPSPPATTRQRKLSYANVFGGGGERKRKHSVQAILQNVVSEQELISGSEQSASDISKENETKSKFPSVLQPAETQPYTVIASDSLANISARYDGTVSELMKLNKLMSTMICPGQILYVPTSRQQSPELSPENARHNVNGGGVTMKAASATSASAASTKSNCELKPMIHRRRVSFCSVSHPDPDRLAVEIESLKKMTRRKSVVSVAVRTQNDDVGLPKDYTMMSTGANEHQADVDIEAAAAEYITDKQVILGRFQLNSLRLKFTGETSADDDDEITCKITAGLNSLEGAAIYVHISSDCEWKRLEECDPDSLNTLKESVTKALPRTVRVNDSYPLETAHPLNSIIENTSSSSSVTSIAPVLPEKEGTVHLDSMTTSLEGLLKNSQPLSESVPQANSAAGRRRKRTTVYSADVKEELNEALTSYYEDVCKNEAASELPAVTVIVEDWDAGQTKANGDGTETEVTPPTREAEYCDVKIETKMTGSVLDTRSRPVSQSTNGDNDGVVDEDEGESSFDYFYMYVRFSDAIAVGHTPDDTQKENEFWFRVSIEVLFPLHEKLKHRATNPEFSTVPQHIELNQQKSMIKPQPHLLYIVLREGFDLLATDKDGFSNPYVKFKVKNKLVHRSRTLYKSLNPRWAETFVYRFHSIPTANVGGKNNGSVGTTSYRRLTALRIVVRNHSVGQLDDYMGEAELDTNNLTLNESTELKLMLMNPKRKKLPRSGLGYLLLQCLLTTSNSIATLNLQNAMDGSVYAEVLPKMSAKSSILEEQHIIKLTGHLPARLEGCRWSLCFDTKRDGFTLSTVYRRMSTSAIDDGPSLLVVKDSQHQVFGAYLTCSLKASENFYGGGESFLFTFFPQFKNYSWARGDDYFIRSDSDGLIIGAGGGSYGLWLDDNLFRGQSRRCSTFENEPLTSLEDFTVSSVEIWTFQ